MSIRKILVVEDALLLHRLYDMLLFPYKQAGAKIVNARNGREALDALAAHPDTDLILLDINMPVMSGLEFLAHRRRERLFEAIPVIIITTEGKEQDTMRGLAAGARAYITKPFQAQDLRRVIERIFAPAPAPEHATAAPSPAPERAAAAASASAIPTTRQA